MSTLLGDLLQHVFVGGPSVDHTQLLEKATQVASPDGVAAVRQVLQYVGIEVSGWKKVCSVVLPVRHLPNPVICIEVIGHLTSPLKISTGPT